MNESLIQDFSIILDNLEVGHCEYFYETIQNSIISEGERQQHYSSKVKFRLIEILLKHFPYKDTKDTVLTIADSLVSQKFCKMPLSV